MLARDVVRFISRARIRAAAKNQISGASALFPYP